MTKTRAWSAGAAVVGVLLIVAAWFLLISPQRSEAASLRDEATQQSAANAQIKLKTQQLKAQFASLPARQAQLAEIKQQMPENPALPSLVRDLSKYADQAEVVLQSVAPSTPAPLTAAANTTTAGATSTTGIEQIQTTVVATGSYAELTLYLQKLQSKMRRAVLVDNVALVPATSDGAAKSDLQMTLLTHVFVLDSSKIAASVGAVGTTTPSTSNAS
ncbi:type 4a pilus biogenesis protein PilO [Angustibacter luteus]|uniref:Type 4a pilus biogenesis protein PilO n=1 Tax=Angustibacter luteus TaxID=658456 RepID=A0ABW1J9N7_9ACTN